MSVWTLLVAIGILGNIALPNTSLLNALLASIAFIWAFFLIYLFAKLYIQLRFKTKGEGFGEGDIYLALIIWLYTPIFFSFQNILFSWANLIKILVLFILISSIIWLLRAGIQYIWYLKYTISLFWGQGNLKFGNKSTSLENSKWKGYSEFWFRHQVLQPELNSKFKIIPFFPAMIIAFRLLLWKGQFFITLIFG